MPDAADALEWAVEYTKALDSAWVPTDHHPHPSLRHGILNLTDDVTAAANAIDRLADRIRERWWEAPS